MGVPVWTPEATGLSQSGGYSLGSRQEGWWKVCREKLSLYVLHHTQACGDPVPLSGNLQGSSLCGGGLSSPKPRRDGISPPPSLMPAPMLCWGRGHSTAPLCVWPSLAHQAALLLLPTHCASGQLGVLLRGHQLQGHLGSHGLAGGAMVGWAHGGACCLRQWSLKVNRFYMATGGSASWMPPST